jgi:hypothetical protein
MSNNIDHLVSIFRDVFDDDELTLGATTTADDIDGWDSLAHIRVSNTIEILNKLDVAYSFMVDPREISAEDFVLSKQSLPRFDCNKFEHGAAS